ncbi:NUDIX hydrolase [Xylanibacillus composti]|nr:NUDIX hydrolase [Xylanibacillus composti]MDT9726656.1 NUDIX hydrolase [Xylanibacillus composti]
MNDNSRKLEEITTRIEPVFEGKIISLQIEHVELPNGQTSTREVVKHPGAVAVLALRHGKMLAVEQYRKAMSRTLVEIPAGKLDPGEEPIDAAARELEEETGFRTDTLTYLHAFYTSPGFADEIIHLYATDRLVEGEVKPDEDEFLELLELTLEEAKQMIALGRIRDAKTIMAVYAWERYEREGSFAL